MRDKFCVFEMGNIYDNKMESERRALSLEIPEEEKKEKESQSKKQNHEKKAKKKRLLKHREEELLQAKLRLIDVVIHQNV